MSSDDIRQLRRFTNETADDSEYTDDYLQAVIDGSVDLNAAAAKIWREKAAKMADLVDMQEGNSRRSWSKAHEQALAMAASYDAQSEDNTVTLGRPTARSRKITRS